MSLKSQPGFWICSEYLLSSFYTIETLGIPREFSAISVTMNFAVGSVANFYDRETNSFK